MAINLGGMMPPMDQPVAASTTAPTLTLNLEKNDVLDLTKREPGLTKVTLGAGWDVSTMGQSFDLDISAFLLNEQGKITDVGNQVIYFNNKVLPGIQLMGDNRTGVGEGDDEQIQMDLNQIPATIQKVVFLVTIAGAQEKRQTFGMVRNSYVRLLDTLNGEREICKFNLTEQGSTATAIVFAELERQGSDWKFKAIGDGKMADLNGLLNLYC